MIVCHPLSRALLSCCLRCLALLLILSSCTPLSNGNKQPGIRHFIDTWNNIHIFQTFDYNISDPLPLAKRYDFVWGAQLDHISAFRSANPNIFISYYIPFDRDWGIFPKSDTRRNFAYWRALHPDWILYKCDRVTPAYTSDYPNVPLDFTDPAVVSWQIRTYAEPASVNGYDGIAVDNIVLPNFYDACGVYRNGQWVQHYSGQVDDPQWRADIITWLKRMQQALHHLKHPLALISNFYVGNLSFSDPQVQQLVNYNDGLLDEDGFTDLGRGYITDGNWVQRVQFMESVQKQHKPYYIIDKYPSIGRAEIQWALASYLMGKEHAAALFISALQGYGAFRWYDEYNAQIGSPTGPMYQMQHVYFRDYSHGLSIVNPSATETYIVNLNTRHDYVDLYGHPVSQTIKMPPHSGMVFLIHS